jgi:hypothetical protein
MNKKRPVEEANGPKDLLSSVFSMIIITIRIFFYRQNK